MFFALELKLSKTLSGLVYFVLHFFNRGGLRPSYKHGTTYTSPLRVFDNFNSKAKAQATYYLDPLANEPPCLTFGKRELMSTVPGLQAVADNFDSKAKTSATFNFCKTSKVPN